MAQQAATARTAKGTLESGPVTATRKGPNSAATSPLPRATVVLRRPVRPLAAAAWSATYQVSGARAAPTTIIATWAAQQGGRAAQDHGDRREQAGEGHPQGEGRLGQGQRRAGVGPQDIGGQALAGGEAAGDADVVGAVDGRDEGHLADRHGPRHEGEAHQGGADQPR